MSAKGVEPLSIADILSGKFEKTACHDQHGQLFRIGELAQEFGLSLRTLRFYEDKGLLKPRRAGLTRLYSHEDYTRLRLIVFGRQIGFTLMQTRQLIDLWKNGGSSMRQLNSQTDGQLNGLHMILLKKLDELHVKKHTIERTILELQTLVTRLASPYS